MPKPAAMMAREAPISDSTMVSWMWPQQRNTRPVASSTARPAASVALTYDCTCGVGGTSYARPQLMVAPASLTEGPSRDRKGSVQCSRPRR